METMSFNGAAAKSSGKCNTDRVVPRYWWRPSMGPPLKAAENAAMTAWDNGKKGTLQWGRR